MSAWNAKYNDDQRAAIELAAIDERTRPLAKIAELAAAGRLRATPTGEFLPPFEIPDSTVVSMKSKAERRRAGLALPRDLANLPPRDRAEAMQRRLTAVIDREISRIESAQAKRPKDAIDAEQTRKIARALRELATLPDPHEPRLPRTPGERDGGTTRPDAPTQDSLAGKLLAASDKSRALSLQPPEPARDPHPATSNTTQGDTQPTTGTTDPHGSQTQPANTTQPHDTTTTSSNEPSCSDVGLPDLGLSVDLAVVTGSAP